MSRTKPAVVGVIATVLFAFLVLPSAMAATSSPSLTPDQVTFDSTMVNQFAGISNGPSGSETTEIQATISIAPQSDGSYSGSAMGKYAQATGTISETCMANSTTGTTTETEESGTPTTFTATYTPGATGGTVAFDFGSFTGGLSESFLDHPGCGGPDVGNTTPRWLADFESIHSAQLTPSLAHPGDVIFTFNLAPTATTSSLPGAPVLAGVYNSNGSFTNNNLTANETTSLSLWATASTSTTGTTGNGGTTCTVPNVKGDMLAAAKTAIRHAGCRAGTVKRRKSSKHNRGRVLSQTPRAGSSHADGTKVALTIGK
jgi:PASTA domain